MTRAPQLGLVVGRRGRGDSRSEILGSLSQESVIGSQLSVELVTEVRLFARIVGRGMVSCPPI